MDNWTQKDSKFCFSQGAGPEDERGARESDLSFSLAAPLRPPGHVDHALHHLLHLHLPLKHLQQISDNLENRPWQKSFLDLKNDYKNSWWL